MKTDVIRTAKIRLQRMSLVQSGDDSIFLNGKKLPLSEVARYRQLIAEVLAEDEFINPLEILTDKKELSKMDEETKQRYLLNLSSVYLKLRNSMR